MKGKELKLKQVLNLPHETRIIVSSCYGIQCNALVNQEKQMIGNYDELGIDNCIWYFNNLENNIKSFDIIFYEYIDSEKEENSYQGKQFYYGDEILKLIREGKILNAEFEVIDIKTGKHRSNLIIKNGSIMYFDGDMNVSIDYLVNDKFYPIKEKEYLTFDEARKSDKKFKYKDWENYGTLPQVFFNLFRLSTLGLKDNVNEIMDSKGWELEND